MNKDKILATAVVYWSKSDDCYIAESAMDEFIVGDGDTPEEAMESFRIQVEANYKAYLANKHIRYPRAGRPARDKASLNSQVRPATLETIKALSKTMNTSQGDIVDMAIKIMTQGDVSILSLGKELTSVNTVTLKRLNP